MFGRIESVELVFDKNLLRNGDSLYAIIICMGGLMLACYRVCKIVVSSIGFSA